MSICILIQSTSAEVVSELSEKVEVLERLLSKQQILIYILFGLIVLFVAVLFFIVKRILNLQIETDRTQNLRLQEIEQKLQDSLASANNNVNVLKDQVESLKRTQTRTIEASRQPQPMTSQANQASTQNSQRSSSSSNIGTTPQNVVKYFSLQQGEGVQLSVLDRHLVDDSSMAWFKMTISGNNATFEINQNSVSSILADIPQLHSYTNPFDSVTNPSQILTVRPGQMRKEGKSWIVTQKITIKLA